ncbi:CoA-transferase family III [Pedococcus dokdonensis]|uniref:CoA-transferase family III n=1 Tax=Pedococcus dokdonensis TaxID=443156 RepID=A0A1H0QR60_9MICO|nr:CoA transferase [Pedococcus dokdonensis]SDP19814.1 CoA-transferase family III [Pedococcus dokdonensis]
MNHLLRELLPTLDVEEAYAERVLDLGAGAALPSALPVNTLACGSVAAAGLAGAALWGGRRVRVDPRQVAVSFRNDQVQTVDGAQVPGFAPLSGFFEAADGWVRTHANYPHHHVRLLRALGLREGATRDDAAAAVRQRSAQELEDVVTADHGIAVRVRDHSEWMASEQAAAVRQHPLLAVARVGDEADPVRPAVPGRPKVLDLTRVLAGPVATRTLALLGCDVLRVDSPHLPELDAIHLDTDSGKRSTLVDLQDEHARTRLHQLLDHADVLVTGYRPGALAAYHLDAESVAAQHPHVIHASLSAWTPSGPWGGRRGFDSIVQAATGIALLESRDGTVPGALPAQALDHATGYLLAAGVLTALRRRSQEGGTWRVEAHLARTAHWLLQTDALDGPVDAVDDVAPWTVGGDTAYGHVVQARPALTLDDSPREFAWVGRRHGADEPTWDNQPT